MRGVDGFITELDCWLECIASCRPEIGESAYAKEGLTSVQFLAPASSADLAGEHVRFMHGAVVICAACRGVAVATASAAEKSPAATSAAQIAPAANALPPEVSPVEASETMEALSEPQKHELTAHGEGSGEQFSCAVGIRAVCGEVAVVTVPATETSPTATSATQMKV